MRDKRKKSPVAATFLALIPGFGAIYNGEFVKGIAFIAVFSIIIAILDKNPGELEEAILGISLVVFYFYTIYDSYKVASEMNKEVDLISEENEKDVYNNTYKLSESKDYNPFFGFFVLLSGIVILLLNFDVISWGNVRAWWPVLIIAVGIHIVYKNTRKGGLK